MRYVDKKKFIYINWPLYPNHNKISGNKKFLLCMIASNKTLNLSFMERGGIDPFLKIIFLVD